MFAFLLEKVLWVISFSVFLRQPFSQVIVFIDWREDTQYPEGSVDGHFKLRRNSLLLLFFPAAAAAAVAVVVDYVRSLFGHFPEQ